ncbi:hypothetical protein DFH09DRAFT_1308311 [Mycena vulgaris]|nr:hypothetical protein DFH09DRAFT_1308311 [Mycena vulgaris]
MCAGPPSPSFLPLPLLLFFPPSASPHSSLLVPRLFVPAPPPLLPRLFFPRPRECPISGTLRAPDHTEYPGCCRTTVGDATVAGPTPQQEHAGRGEMGVVRRAARAPAMPSLTHPCPCARLCLYRGDPRAPRATASCGVAARCRSRVELRGAQRLRRRL